MHPPVVYSTHSKTNGLFSPAMLTAELKCTMQTAVRAHKTGLVTLTGCTGHTVKHSHTKHFLSVFVRHSVCPNSSFRNSLVCLFPNSFPLLPNVSWLQWREHFSERKPDWEWTSSMKCIINKNGSKVKVSYCLETRKLLPLHCIMLSLCILDVYLMYSPQRPLLDLLSGTHSYGDSVDVQ